MGGVSWHLLSQLQWLIVWSSNCGFRGRAPKQIQPCERNRLPDSITSGEPQSKALSRMCRTPFLFAGNSDSDAEFTQAVPAGLHLPNLLAVGAVNQAGDETSFTSYGSTVVVDAAGYEVKSNIPGGGMVRWSGTSIASPNVANLAAKLFALDPSLSPEQVIDLIKRGATTSEDGRRHLVDEKRSVALLQERAKN